MSCRDLGRLLRVHVGIFSKVRSQNQVLVNLGTVSQFFSFTITLINSYLDQRVYVIWGFFPLYRVQSITLQLIPTASAACDTTGDALDLSPASRLEIRFVDVSTHQD